MTRDAVVCVVDYGAGNLHSLVKALEESGKRVVIEPDPARAADRRKSDLLVLPGVGAFGAAAAQLVPARKLIREWVVDGLPILGICLGMQLLFGSSDEGAGAGLCIIPGSVRRLRARRVPQIGWNLIERAGGGWQPDCLALDVAYYANSFVCEPEDASCVTAWTTYESDRFPAAVIAGPNENVVGLQFHPEKSSAAGVRYLRALVSRACTTHRP